MKNKIVIYILGILFIITFSLGLIGLLNKKNNQNTDPTPINGSIKKITYNNETKDIVSFYDKISAFEFVKSNKWASSGYLELYIENDEIIIKVQKKGIKNASEEVPEVIEYKIDNIENPTAIQAQMLFSEGNIINVYTLDTYGRLFLSSFEADPAFYNGITTYQFNVNNIVSFVSMNIPLTGEVDLRQNYVIFKTEDGSYYTDYKFDIESEVKIYKINNVESE